MQPAPSALPQLWRATTSRLEGVGSWLAPLGLRLILAWEFGEAGLEKLRGENWFAHVQDDFPLPFSLVSAELSWALATWVELLGAAALVLGLFTRFFAFSLFVLTFVATAAVHWPDSWSTLGELWQGYAISNDGYGNYKLPLLFALMLLPLVLNGAGKLSLDHALGARLLPTAGRPRADAAGWSLAAIGLGLPLAALFPAFGLALAGLGAAVLAWTARAGAASAPG
jgi:putative oxidoreductase